MDKFLFRMKSLLGDEYSEFLKYYEAENFRGLRVNTLKCTPEKLINLLDFELKNTPFCKEGFYIPEDVVSLGKENSELCEGCHSDGRICCNYVVCAQQRHLNRIKVIIIGEEYGY